MVLALFFSGIISSMFAGTLIEYWFHRAMHAKIVMGEVHMDHHRNNDVENWLSDLVIFYFPRLLPVLLLPFVVCFFEFSLVWLCLGWLIGGTFYLTLFAFCHKLHHTHPEVLWWLNKHMHYMHHEVDIRYNYGVVVDWWDRVFGTYKAFGPYSNKD